MLLDYKWEQMKVSTTEVEIPVGKMTIGRFEVGWNGIGCLLHTMLKMVTNLLSQLTIAGSVYQAPQRRLAYGVSININADHISMATHEQWELLDKLC